LQQQPVSMTAAVQKAAIDANNFTSFMIKLLLFLVFKGTIKFFYLLTSFFVSSIFTIPVENFRRLILINKKDLPFLNTR